jgi:hypothetical protein
MIEEFWQKSKAKKMWDNLQSSSKNQQVTEENIPQPTTQ